MPQHRRGHFEEHDAWCACRCGRIVLHKVEVVSTQTQLEIGSDFLGYRIEEVVGRGGMGVVYRAYDLRLKRTVALKLITPELALDERFNERFARETELTMALEHPNVVPIHDAGDVDGRLYLAMRLVEGTDLRALLGTAGALSPARALAICGQVASALDAAHGNGLVHRDVKPSNVLLDANEHVYLADFGLTRRLEAEGAQAGVGRSLGTPAYLAPEQIEGKPVDGRADVYALGCVLYECLTGSVPYRRTSRLAAAWAHLEEEPPRASELGSELPTAIDAVIQRALAKDPVDRYPTCAALIAAAEEALELRRPPTLRWRRLLGVLVVLVALVAAVAAALFSRNGAAPSVTPESLVKIDLDTNEIVDVIPVGRNPREVEIIGNYVFVASESDGTLTRVDRRTGAVLNSGQYDAGDGLAGEGDDRLWVASVGRGEVVVVDAELPVVQVEDRVSVPRIPLAGDAASTSLAVGGGSLWIATEAAVERWRLHPLRRERTYQLEPDGDTNAAAFGNGASASGGAWITLAAADDLLYIDARDGRATRISVGNFPFGIATGHGSVWVAMFGDDSVWRIDPVTGRVRQKITVGSRPMDVAVGPESVWVTNHCDGTLSRLDVASETVIETIEIGFHPRWLAVDDRFAWVGVSENVFVPACF
jgi:YVTN family beta-propeller protein